MKVNVNEATQPQKDNMTDFKPPTDPALHALWVIRNWTRPPMGNMQKPEDILRQVHKLAQEVLKSEELK
jgi:hypothetical protein